MTEETLYKISQIINKLKFNFPMISTPNPNNNDILEKEKLKEWVNQLKDLNLDSTMQSIDDLIRNGYRSRIDSLIKQPLVELRKMTYEMNEKIRMENTLKLEEKPVKVASPEFIEKLLKESGIYG